MMPVVLSRAITCVSLYAAIMRVSWHAWAVCRVMSPVDVACRVACHVQSVVHFKYHLAQERSFVTSSALHSLPPTMHSAYHAALAPRCHTRV